MATARNLGTASLTTLLVSAHYGLGFILGTAEKSFTDGPIGSLYAVAVGLGMMSLAWLAQFYWNRIDPLWTLLGDRYGYPVKVGIGLMSWSSLIGIEAVQIISAAAILEVVGLPVTLTMVSIAVVFCLLSLLPLEKASWLFRGLLLFNILVLGAALWQLDHGEAYERAILDFWPMVSQGVSTKIVGVAVATVLLVLIDMKCQQFVVRSQSPPIARWSCLFSGLILVALAFLPTAIVNAAQQRAMLPADVTGKTAIPYILSWLGGGIQTPWGILFVASLALPALGLGSSILRIQTKANLDIFRLSNTAWHQAGIASLNAILALAVALRGGEIVGLILSFYAAYLAAIWVPFSAYLLEQGQVFVFSVASVQVALLTGGIAALLALGMHLLTPDFTWFNSPELTILGIGAGLSISALFTTQIGEAILLLFKRVREDSEA